MPPRSLPVLIFTYLFPPVEIPNNFCFVINRGKAEYVKYVESFDNKWNDYLEKEKLIVV